MRTPKARTARREPKPDRPRVAFAPRSALANYAIANVRVLLESLGRIYRTPLTSLMTAAVIGIALALPTGLLVLLQNLQTVSGGWDGGAQISVFLDLSVSDQRAAQLAETLGKRDEIESIRTLSRTEALEEFRQLSGFGDALGALAENPLPAVLVIRPHTRHSDPESLRRLVEELRALPEAELAQLDLQWVKRLYAIMETGQRGVYVVSGLLALAVLLVVGNTIRLDIENRREEIIITKLIGATNAFIRRPFLYSGLWYGLLGGILAWVLIALSLGLVAGPVQQLAGLYGSGFQLSGLGLLAGLTLLAISALLGLIGSWVAVGRHLTAIEPT